MKSRKSTCWAGDVGCRNICTLNLEYERLDVVIGDSLDVAIANLLVPNEERLAADRVKDRQEPALEGVLEHFCCQRVGAS